VTHSPAWLPLVIVATSRLFAQTGADRPEPAVASMLLEPEQNPRAPTRGGQSHEYRFTYKPANTPESGRNNAASMWRSRASGLMVKNCSQPMPIKLGTVKMSS